MLNKTRFLDEFRHELCAAKEKRLLLLDAGKELLEKFDRDECLAKDNLEEICSIGEQICRMQKRMEEIWPFLCGKEKMPSSMNAIENRCVWLEAQMELIPFFCSLTSDDMGIQRMLEESGRNLEKLGEMSDDLSAAMEPFRTFRSLLEEKENRKRFQLARSLRDFFDPELLLAVCLGIVEAKEKEIGLESAAEPVREIAAAKVTVQDSEKGRQGTDTVECEAWTGTDAEYAGLKAPEAESHEPEVLETESHESKAPEAKSHEPEVPEAESHEPETLEAESHEPKAPETEYGEPGVAGTACDKEVCEAGYLVDGERTKRMETVIVCRNLIQENKIYCALAYAKAQAIADSQIEPYYKELAYAVNDPMAECTYNSDTIFLIYFNDDEQDEYLTVAAMLRNYFYNQCSFDYQMLQLMESASSFRLMENSLLRSVMYDLLNFKRKYHCGIDRYADYREKERRDWEKRLDEVKLEAGKYYSTYVHGMIKETASHKRVIETRKMIFHANGELSTYLQGVQNDERSLLPELKQFLMNDYVKEQGEICAENIDNRKLNAVLDSFWGKAGNQMNVIRHSSDLMSHLRNNLLAALRKTVAVLCSYVHLLDSCMEEEEGTARSEYSKLKKTLLERMEVLICEMEEKDGREAGREAGETGTVILAGALRELKARLDGSWNENSSRWFYLDFLKGQEVLLDEDNLPMMNCVEELPQLDISRRILAHAEADGAEITWEECLDRIFNGYDNYGSAARVLEYLCQQCPNRADELRSRYNLEEAIEFPQNDALARKNGFIADLELAQSYGQIDYTDRDRKEAMVQIADRWYQWAVETKNFQFFYRILEGFSHKVKEESRIHGKRLTHSLQMFQQEHPELTEREKEAAKLVKERIESQNYSAAEDLLNRILSKDLENSQEIMETDYLNLFLQEYETNYFNVSQAGISLRTQILCKGKNKDRKAAERLADSWLSNGARAGEEKIQVLLINLGFAVEQVQEQEKICDKIENYQVYLKKPVNGRKNNYVHPIAAFGSGAEQDGFRVVCLHGRTDARRLMDTFREIGNARHTLVLLDYSLTIDERQILARGLKLELSGRIFAVIDRVVMAFLINHGMETSVNRILMAVIMPYAAYQPYISESAVVMPQEMFMGRRRELETIEAWDGVNIVYGGRQLGKSALLRMAWKDVDRNENGDRAVLVDIKGLNDRKAAEKISFELAEAGILSENEISEDWYQLTRQLKRRLRSGEPAIPYLLLLLDEADTFLESCEAVNYAPFDALKDVQSIGSGRFKFVIAGLRNVVRFKRKTALKENSVLTHMRSLTVKPFCAAEARTLLEEPLSYLGFRFPKNRETDALISTIFSAANYFPGLIQMYCEKLLETVMKDYAGYSAKDTPPYVVGEEQIKKVLAQQEIQQQIREKFFITLKVDNDDFYYIIALIMAFRYHDDDRNYGVSSPEDIIQTARDYGIEKIGQMETETVAALMEEMCELNLLWSAGNGGYRFARHSFCQMMGDSTQIDKELVNYMGE